MHLVNWTSSLEALQGLEKRVGSRSEETNKGYGSGESPWSIPEIAGRRTYVVTLPIMCLLHNIPEGSQMMTPSWHFGPRKLWLGTKSQLVMIIQFNLFYVRSDVSRLEFVNIIFNAAISLFRTGQISWLLCPWTFYSVLMASCTRSRDCRPNNVQMWFVTSIMFCCFCWVNMKKIINTIGLCDYKFFICIRFKRNNLFIFWMYNWNSSLVTNSRWAGPLLGPPFANSPVPRHRASMPLITRRT